MVYGFVILKEDRAAGVGSFETCPGLLSIPLQDSEQP
jgi:hypothetical protein